MEAPKIEMSDQEILDRTVPYDPWNPMWNPKVPCGYCGKLIFTGIAMRAMQDPHV